MEEQEIEGAKNNDRLNLPREKAARSMQFLRTEFLSRFRAMIPRNGSVTKGLAAEVERKAGKLFPPSLHRHWHRYASRPRDEI